MHQINRVLIIITMVMQFAWYFIVLLRKIELW